MNRAVSLSLCVVRNKNIALLLLFLAGLLFFGPLHAQESLRGLVFEHDRYDSLPLPQDYGKHRSLPTKASIRQYLPRVVNQASYNNAVSWSLVWYARTALEASARHITSTEPEHRNLPLAPAFIHSLINGGDCGSPVSLIDALEVLHRSGAPRFTDYRSICGGQIDDELRRTAQRFRLPGYVRLFNSYDPGDTKIRELKKALSEGGSVVLGMICPPSFSLAGEFWQPRELEADEKYGGHALTLVGYDDARFGGAFEVVNTWGPQWGKGGFTWIRYADVARHFKYAFRLLEPAPSLKASVQFIRPDGSMMPVTSSSEGVYSLSGTYTTGDRFQVGITSPDGVFPAVIVRDPTGAAAEIFPGHETTYAFITSDIWLPGRGSYFTLTEPAGRNELYFLFARHHATLQEAVNAIMNGKRYAHPGEKTSGWRKDLIQFESSGDLVVITVELHQH